MSRPTFESQAARGFSDVDIAAQLEMPLPEVWRRLADLPPEQMKVAERARLSTEAVTKPIESRLHGDLCERVEKYFCYRCNSYEDAEHFREHSRDENLRALRFSEKVLRRLAGEHSVTRGCDGDANLIDMTMDLENEALLDAFNRGDI